MKECEFTSESSVEHSSSEPLRIASSSVIGTKREHFRRPKKDGKGRLGETTTSAIVLFEECQKDKTAYNYIAASLMQSITNSIQDMLHSAAFSVNLSIGPPP